jgi:hypothetical protein
MGTNWENPESFSHAEIECLLCQYCHPDAEGRLALICRRNGIQQLLFYLFSTPAFLVLTFSFMLIFYFYFYFLEHPSSPSLQTKTGNRPLPRLTFYTQFLATLFTPQKTAIAQYTTAVTTTENVFWLKRKKRNL